MKEFYTKVYNEKQIFDLEKVNLKNGIKFFYSLFFKSVNYSRKYLLNTNKCVIYYKNGLISCGNIENIPNEWEEKEYINFIEEISS